MASNKRSQVSASSGNARQGALKETDQPSKEHAGSALSQQPKKASVGSTRVIKSVSDEHHDALRRLVDR